MNYLDFISPIGNIRIYEEEGFLVSLVVNKDFSSKENLRNGNFKTSAVLIEAKTQLQEYFEGNRKIFNIPVKLNTTEFISKVLDEVKTIPYGKTETYGNIALAIGVPMASRAVGMANNKNPIPIIIPCHRVIGKDGSLKGYAYGLELKNIF